MTPVPAGIRGGPDPSLKELIALGLDCQTTGPSADRDHLLEIGWVRIDPTSAEGPLEPAAHLVALPNGTKIPPKVAQLTGVQECDLKTARTPEQVWHKLLKTAADLPVPAGGSGGIALIHYARFERPFLKALHARCCPGSELPFEIVCTHAIARRLLPHLPRCGLRALAGYFGDPVGESKRAGDHAAATRSIWHGLLPLLGAQGIRRWSHLMSWLNEPAAVVRQAKHYPMPRGLRLNAPDAPGVYRLRRANGDLLYIGKARSLKHRINSYFQSRRRHPEHILEMLTQARDLDYTLTPSALEAALLEADLIKQANPPYNIALKPREYAPVYFSANYQTAGQPGQPELPVGPLPSERALAAFGFVVLQCGRSHPALPADAQGLAAALNVPAPYLPPLSVLGEGLNLYRKICGPPVDLTRTGRRLLKRGLWLWRQDLAGCLDTSEDEKTVRTGAEKEWSAPEVVTMLDGIVRRGSQLVRRGRWLEILASATLRWEAAGQDTRAEHALCIRHGRIHAVPCGAVSRGGTPPPSPAASRAACRHVFTSAATYDRLRVLTTELRRLIGEGRRVYLLPAVGGPLDNRALARLLNLI